MAKILLVEDTVELAQGISNHLRVEDYVIIHAQNGIAAIQLHAQETPDLVILDWLLPDIDGLQVLQSIRRISTTPILMLTSRNLENDRVEGLQAGADDYLTKPFSMRELSARIKALLRREALLRETLLADREPDREVVNWDNIRVDPTNHEVLIDSDPIDFSATEFALLYLFIRHPGRTFSRDYLLDVVWGDSSVPGDRAVDNAIARIRKKLGDYSDLIEARWGVGYRWRR